VLRALCLKNESQISEFYAVSDSKRPKLMEIFTPSKVNDKVLKEFFQSMETIK
jgi:hypothetical protein